MKEIGETLKEARENIGLTLEEVSSDLKLRPTQLENIEAGNVEAFKDIFYLKSLIKEYAKYLGINYEDMIDEFNEYLFDRTSRISLADIKKAKKKASKKETRIASPYTIDRKNISITKIIIISLVVLIIVISTVIFVNKNNEKNKEPETAIID